MRVKITFTLGCVLLLVLACSSSNRRKIYLLPLGGFPDQTIDQLAVHYKNKFNVTIEKLPSMPLDSTMIDQRRNQVVAESLIAMIRQQHPNLESDPNAIVIGLTRADMYIHKYDWKFAFNFRQDNRFAVISVARMDPINFGEPADESLLNTRLRKMVTKNIGILYFRKSLNNNPRSVLYSSVEGLEELDAMSEEF
jgi:predicted Zn-dependent protease